MSPRHPTDRRHQPRSPSPQPPAPQAPSLLPLGCGLAELLTLAQLMVALMAPGHTHCHTAHVRSPAGLRSPTPTYNLVGSKRNGHKHRLQQKSAHAHREPEPAAQASPWSEEVTAHARTASTLQPGLLTPSSRARDLFFFFFHFFILKPRLGGVSGCNPPLLSRRNS